MRITAYRVTEPEGHVWHWLWSRAFLLDALKQWEEAGGHEEEIEVEVRDGWREERDFDLPQGGYLVPRGGGPRLTLDQALQQGVARVVEE